MLIDEVEIKIKAGKGGDGLVSFRHEKFVAKGGPDGGDGGVGGSIYFETDSNLRTLFDFKRLKNFQAESGEAGKPKKQTGKNGQDLILKVPPGTLVFENEELIFDLTQKDEIVLAAKGGRGGWGNVHFKSPTHQTPREFKPGLPGQEKHLRLELKMLAEVGIIGLPNAGKSTLLSVISNARPKIAAYPFTTLEPNLGVVRFQGKEFIAADIPGLIEGASKGKGLGDRFLKHIERTKVLVHLLDALRPDLAVDYQTIRRELKAYSPKLAKKPEIIVINKIDTAKPEFSAKDFPKKPLLISAVTHQGVKELQQEILKKL
ncbi:GTPase ObgE [Candidatus Berkelbacteria bacterium]|nr:GTPase ObgE [Candidatus Berkelbacteria bacterium]